MSVDRGIAPVLPMPIKAAPYKHQIEVFNFVCGMFGLVPETVEFSARSAGCALLMEMGTGKTLTTIAVTGALLQAGRICRVLIVAPLSILGVWEEEHRKFADFPYCLAVLTGNSAKKLDTLRPYDGERPAGGCGEL